MEDELDIRKYGRVFLRRKWIFIVIFFGILLFTWIRTALTPKTFLASSKILIKKTPALYEGSRISEEAFGIETNCEILKSRGFIERVVSYMKEMGVKIGFLNDNNAPDFIIGMTEVIPIKNANIIEIRVKTPDAEESASIANSVAESFAKYSIEIARAKVTEKRKFIENKLPELEKKLEESEQAIQKFKEEEGLISVSAGGSALQQQLINLQGEHSSILSQISTEESLIVSLGEGLKQENKRLAEEIVKIDNSSLLNLRTQLLTLSNQYSTYVLAGLPEDHPKLIELDRKINDLKQRLTQKAKERTEEEILLTDPLFFVKGLSEKILDERAKLLSLKAMKSATEERIKDYTSRIRNFPQKEYALARLERDCRFNESVYQRLIEDYEETKISEVSEIGNVVITEKAIPPLVPILPNTMRNMALALVFGLGLGIASVLLLEYLDTSIKDIEEVTKLKIPVTGTIPITGTIPEHTEDVIKNPMSGPAEAYKKLRMNLRFAIPYSSDGSLKTLLVSSCRPKEGKTTVVSNLGVTFARAEIKTVVVEGDLRKPSLHKMFRISSKIGLTNLLVGDVRKEDIIYPTQIKNLWLIPAGHLPPNPGELIDSENMRRLISDLKKEFEMVIIDSPPLISCADGLLLGSAVDGVILVLELGGTPREHLLQVMAGFKSANTSFVGVVINKTKEKLHYRYPYYTYTSTPETKGKAL